MEMPHPNPLVGHFPSVPAICTRDLRNVNKQARGSYARGNKVGEWRTFDKDGSLKATKTLNGQLRANLRPIWC